MTIIGIYFMIGLLLAAIAVLTLRGIYEDDEYDTHGDNFYLAAIVLIFLCVLIWPVLLALYLIRVVRIYLENLR